MLKRVTSLKKGSGGRGAATTDACALQAKPADQGCHARLSEYDIQDALLLLPVESAWPNGFWLITIFADRSTEGPASKGNENSPGRGGVAK